MYAERVDTMRKAVAVAFTVCGLGFAVSANVGPNVATTVLGLGALASLIAALGLFVEYLVRSRLEGRKGGVAAYQLTLAEMMVVIAAVALVLGVFRILGLATIVLLVDVVLLLACGLEMVRRRATEERRRRASDRGPRLPAEAQCADASNSQSRQVDES